MEKEIKKICGNCKWSKQEVPWGEYYCENPEADAYGCENTYTDSCYEWTSIEDE